MARPPGEGSRPAGPLDTRSAIAVIAVTTATLGSRFAIAATSATPDNNLIVTVIAIIADMGDAGRMLYFSGDWANASGRRWWVLAELKRRARALKVEVYALYLAYRDPRVPWYARLFAAGVVAYAFSPIDLIPDVIPVLGYLDDLILVPLGIQMALRLIPAPVMAECRTQAAVVMALGKPVNWGAAVVIVALWVGLAALAVAWLARVIQY